MTASVYVGGIGSTAFGAQPERSLEDLAIEAGAVALSDAGLKPGEVGMGVFANALAGKLFGDLTVGQNVFSALGMTRLPVINVENACSSGSTAFYLACLAVRAGETDCALVVGAEKMCVPQLGLLSSGDSDLDTMLGMVTPASFAMRARRHMIEFGTTTEQLARISVKNRRHGTLNPLACLRSETSVEEVLASPMVADPLTRLQSCPKADGASALIVCSSTIARRIGARVAIRAATLLSGDYENPQDMVRWRTDCEGAAKAYEQAGIGAEDLDLIECHDAFSIAEILHYEALGLCAPGEGGRLAAEGTTALGGRLPVNVSGGLISRGHPVGATGVEQIVEITRHLRRVAGDRQVSGARVGLAHCMGGDRAADTKSMTVAILTN